MTYIYKERKYRDYTHIKMIIHNMYYSLINLKEIENKSDLLGNICKE